MRKSKRLMNYLILAFSEQVLTLLQGIDTIHREALHRLVRLFKEGVLEQVITDPAIYTLMELYDFITESTRRSSFFPNIPIKVIPKANAVGLTTNDRAGCRCWRRSDELDNDTVKLIELDDKEIFIMPPRR